LSQYSSIRQGEGRAALIQEEMLIFNFGWGALIRRGCFLRGGANMRIHGISMRIKILLLILFFYDSKFLDTFYNK